MEKITFKSYIPEEMEKSQSKLANRLRIALRTYATMIEVTELIDFACDFDDEGRCFAHPIAPPSCCCSGCRRHNGYFNSVAVGSEAEENVVFVPLYRNAIKSYNRHFNDKTGFWRAGKGCILPRKYRSTTCVFYNCLERKGKNREARIIYDMQIASDRMVCTIRKLIEEWKKANSKSSDN